MDPDSELIDEIVTSPANTADNDERFRREGVAWSVTAATDGANGGSAATAGVG